MTDTVALSSTYVFLPWVRQGAAAGIKTPDSLGADQAGVVSVPVTLRVNDTDEVTRQVRLYGPGDVTGIDPQQVVRTNPSHLARDFEPNYFPAVDFDRPDFPWLFTPAASGAGERLRPWLCLVVVQKQDGVTLRADRALPLPVLEIKAPARPEHELPDLSESWAWAHAQVTGSTRDPASLRAALAGDPALTVSRLVCPRRLDPETEYLACVVPAFELGCKAGLGLPIPSTDEEELKPAWTTGPQAPSSVRLPVYFQWEFRTGTAGDFEALVRLESRPLPPEVGRRPIDISRPGFGVTPPLPVPTTLELEGALRVADVATTPPPAPGPVEPPPDEWPADTRTPFQTALKPIPDAPWQALTLGGTDPLVAPPIYGAWQAARHTVRTASGAPGPVTWLDDLNLDPRHRAAAALGTAVVQAQQEALMAAAWEHLGEIERINQMRRQAQLARAVNGAYHVRHFDRFSEETLMQVVSPARFRVPVANVVTAAPAMLLSEKLARSVIPARAVAAPVRRWTSPVGVVSMRFAASGAISSQMMTMLNTTRIVPAQKREARLMMLEHVADPPASSNTLKPYMRFDRVVSAINRTPFLVDFRIRGEGATPTLLESRPFLPDSPDAMAFRDAAKAHHAYIEQLFPAVPPAPEAPQLNLLDTRYDVLNTLSPHKTVSARVQASLRGARADQPADPLEPILDAPEFLQPMYEALRDLSQDFLLPGLEHVPPNTVALLETNPAFVESFLVGLNTEMSRELLWRDYPTDQRGTYFRRFWDGLADGDEPDIDMIHRWGDRTLGKNARDRGSLVLLLRGELLRRYPNSVIYAVEATRRGEQLVLSSEATAERHPLFRGTLKPDVTFLGFDLTAAKAIADPGWFFVIQQQPTEPTFGLDAANFDELPPLTTWNDLSWRHLAASQEELKALSHVSLATELPDIGSATWRRNAAHQAYITLQRPVRIAIHPSRLLPHVASPLSV